MDNGGEQWSSSGTLRGSLDAASLGHRSTQQKWSIIVTVPPDRLDNVNNTALDNDHEVTSSLDYVDGLRSTTGHADGRQPSRLRSVDGQWVGPMEVQR